MQLLAVAFQEARYSSEQPFFSSPTTAQKDASFCILIGGHDHLLHCLSEDCQLRWLFETSSPLYGTPFVTPQHSVIIANNTLSYLWMVGGE
jgi:hypothetical protein